MEGFGTLPNRNLNETSMRERTIYALGFFDGVHLGHQALLRACRTLADQQGCRAGVVTFGTHPEMLVRGESPVLLSTPQERERLMREKYGMDTVLTLPFDEELRNMTWLEFLIMLGGHGAVGFVCGDDFRFGHKGQGNVELLKEYCTAENLPCVVVPEQLLDGRRVSSTYIRQQIETGDMETAVAFLGHPYYLTGTVVPGQQLGRTLGIPTANLVLPAGLSIPKFGVYACKCLVDGKAYPAVTNIGTRPTVAGMGITVEPWILDFSGDLYGKEITLEFYRFLRPEMKFPDLEALKAEIHKNAQQTRAYFERNKI